MNLTIRKEEPRDYPVVFELIKSAFSEVEFSDHREHLLVERLRKSKSFIPDLSFVGEVNEKIVGHLLLTKINISNSTHSFPSLALAPVSVLPAFQGMGIGGKLILKSHETARKQGYESIVLLGHEKYYPRFGYKRADSFKIEIPFEAPPENCMAIELIESALEKVSGRVEYPDEFYQ